MAAADDGAAAAPRCFLLRRYLRRCAAASALTIFRRVIQMPLYAPRMPRRRVTMLLALMRHAYAPLIRAAYTILHCYLPRYYV